MVRPTGLHHIWRSKWEAGVSLQQGYIRVLTIGTVPELSYVLIGSTLAEQAKLGQHGLLNGLRIQLYGWIQACPPPWPARLPACPQSTQNYLILLTPSLIPAWLLPCASWLQPAQGRCSMGTTGPSFSACCLSANLGVPHGALASALMRLCQCYYIA